jgi:putative flippase GtrA
MTRHRLRFSVFALIGGGVFVAGMALQVLLVRYAGLGADTAYAAQAFFSIELSYLLNRYLTWRDRSVGYWAGCLRFTAQKLLMTTVNMAAYAGLVRLGVQYIAANVLLTAVMTPANYFAADLLVFVGAGRQRVTRAAEPVVPRPPDVPPSVSVVIPCKGSERTIRETVDSFLAQDYPALTEVILVGDVGDSTWQPLADIEDSRLVLVEQEQTPGRRDPNVKRDKGIRKSSGDVLALADSDIVVDPGWLTRAVTLLHGQGGGLVAGGVQAIHDTFWGRFVDNNVLAAKTPRVPRPYQVTAANFGTRGCKPPITANAVFTRELYDSCQLDVGWSYGYEDYEWFWRLAKARHLILFSAELTAGHHHRRSFRQLVREYRQSAHGCAQFIRRHPDSPLARKRAVQAFGLPAAAIGAAALSGIAIAAGHVLDVAGLLGAGAAVLAGREVSRSRSLEAVTYPPAALALGGIYAASIATSLLVPDSRERVAPTWDQGLSGPQRRPQFRLNWPLAAILAVQAGMSLGLVWSNSVFGDEATYLSAGRLEWSHWLHGTPLPGAGQANFGFAGTFQSYFSGAPVIYPPLGALVSHAGGLAAARILGLTFMLGACALLYLTTKRLFGQRAGLFAAGLWAVSGPALRLAFATYDPMAIFLICVGTWLAVESGYRRHRGELVAVAGLVLALAAVTAYSYAIFVPVGILLAVMSWAERSGWPRSVATGGWLTGMAVTMMVLLPTVLKLWQGIFSTTLSRHGGDSGVLSVARTSWQLTGLIAVLAVIGAVAAACSRARKRGQFLLVAFCAAAAVFVPAEQARLQTATSLDKHLAMGAWFAAIAAGYALSELTAAFHWRRAVSLALATAAIAFPAVSGWISAFGVYHLWPDAGPYIAAMRPLVGQSDGNVLVVQYSSMTEYYLGSDANWRRWTALSLAPGYAGVPAGQWQAYYRAQISAVAPRLVAIPFNVTFTSQASGELLLRHLTDSLKSGSQGSLRGVLLEIAAADVSSLEPGFFALASVVANDASYRVVAITPFDSHIATGAFVIWQRVVQPPPPPPFVTHPGGIGR